MTNIDDIKHYDTITLISFIVLILTIVFGIILIIHTILRKEKHSNILVVSNDPIPLI